MSRLLYNRNPTFSKLFWYFRNYFQDCFQNCCRDCFRCQPQEIRYQLGEKIRMNIIIRSLGHAIETIKKDIPRKEAFQELMRRYGYL